MREDKSIVQSYQAHDLKIILNNNEIAASGYNLLDFKMEFKENTHTVVDIEMEIKEEYINEWNTYTKENMSSLDRDNITVVLSFKNRKHFSGIIQKISTIEYQSAGLKIKMNIKSRSELLDREKYYRVYQNPDIRYYDIVREILIAYKNRINIIGIDEEKNSEMINNKLMNKISKEIIIQYYETDWEFLVRIISHLGIAAYNTENGGVTLGLFNNMSISRQWNQLNGNLAKVKEKKEIYYQGESTEYYILGDNIVDVNDMSIGFVTEGNIEYEKGKFLGNYILKNEEYKYPCIYNENIKGCMIEGKVVRVPLKLQDENRIAIMTVDFTEGLKKTAKMKKINNGINTIEARKDYVNINNQVKRFSFPYATAYSKTKTGFFCSPEVGDIVAVIFPTTEENEGYVSWAVNNKESLRFSNPFIRNYKTTEKEQELIGELNNDQNEKININSMEDAVLGTDLTLYNFAVSGAVLHTYTKKSISEETETKSTLAHNEINLVSEEEYSLSSKNIAIAASSNYNEKAEKKKVNISSKESIYDEKREKGSSFEITTNSHKINIK
ncbi:hypothetical protein M2102_001890 [Fusobacterium sp. PH5-7]|uniref:contractile injection system protein, VgrG/Pvc8 family n=1 Tax=Fusobacterium sp. PH5-7 TaxID=2940528 RepID=UPI002472FE0A|nr:contractile injection system protein, VgrG/Pvc8 family [Fusobacterium sp. PH5-7]MDH6458255.1 hypothetical protein [Fusobacterium sp. PH5-7]